MSKIVLLCIVLMTSTFSAVSQDNSQQTFPQSFEKADPQEEITRLEDKKFKLNIRLNELKQKDALVHAEEIARIEGMLKYVDVKIAKQQKILNSNQYAEKSGVPQKGALSDADYRAKKLEFHNQNTEQEPMQIKTTLTRYELEKLPKERQERILSMPERYTIVD